MKLPLQKLIMLHRLLGLNFRDQYFIAMLTKNVIEGCVTK